MSDDREGAMRTFYLIRDEDVTGVSGTGVVAEGCVFSTGWVAMTWTTAINSLVFYPSIENVGKIHGHDGKTRIVFDELATGETHIHIHLDLDAGDIERAVRDALAKEGEG